MKIGSIGCATLFSFLSGYSVLSLVQPNTYSEETAPKAVVLSQLCARHVTMPAKPSRTTTKP